VAEVKKLRPGSEMCIICGNEDALTIGYELPEFDTRVMLCSDHRNYAFMTREDRDTVRNSTTPDVAYDRIIKESEQPKLPAGGLLPPPPASGSSRTTGWVEHDEEVNHPSYYNSHPSGIECVEITKWMSAPIAQAVQYLWRSGLKEGQPSVKDYEKAIWWIRIQIGMEDNA
jgi:hypothetical protein